MKSQHAAFILDAVTREVRCIITADFDSEVASAVAPWSSYQRPGESITLLPSRLYDGKSHAEIAANLQAIVGPTLAGRRLADLPIIPAVEPD